MNQVFNLKNKSVLATTKALIFFSTILSFIGFLFYFPSLKYGFQFDDLASIVKLFEIRTNDFFSLFFRYSRWISYWLNSVYFRWGRYDPFYYRLGNILFHVTASFISCFLTYKICSATSKDSFFYKNRFWFSVLVQTFFLLHPVQTQTVSYVIQGQLEGLAGLFNLLSVFLFCCAYMQTNGIYRKLSLVFMWVVMAISCGTKEIAIISPLLVLLTDWFFVAKGKFASLKSRWALHSFNTFLVFTIFAYFLKPQFFYNLLSLSIEARNNIGNVLTADPTQKILPFHYLISEFKVILHYAWIFIWPFNISIDYDWKMVDSFWAIDCFVPFLVLLAAAYFIFRRLRSNSTDYISFAVIWFFLGILPRASIIPSSELMADYKTYTAAFGVFFIFAFFILQGIYFLLSKFEQFQVLDTKYAISSFAAFVMLLGYSAYSRNYVWSSGEAFWSNVIKNAPDKARGYNNFAVALSEKGKYKESIEPYLKAISMDNRYPDPHNNIAIVYSSLGEIDKAIYHINECLKISPYYPEGYNNLATFLKQKKDYHAALDAVNKAIALRQTYGKAHFNRGIIQFELGQFQEAYESLKTACTKADFDTDLGFLQFAKIAFSMGKHDEAIAGYRRSLELNPNQLEVYVLLAQAYIGKNEFDQAASILGAVEKNAQDNIRILSMIGQFYFIMENYQNAFNCFNRLRSLPGHPFDTYLFISKCFAKLGNIQEAENLLNEILAQNIPEQFKKITLKELGDLRAQQNNVKLVQSEDKTNKKS